MYVLPVNNPDNSDFEVVQSEVISDTYPKIKVYVVGMFDPRPLVETVDPMTETISPFCSVIPSSLVCQFESPLT